MTGKSATGGAGSLTYPMVEATSCAGERGKTTEQMIAVAVTDEGGKESSAPSVSTLSVKLIVGALLALGAVLFSVAGAQPASGAEDDEAAPAASLDAVLWLLQRRRPLGPHAPAPAEVVAASATSLTATWTAPEDADDIVDYDVQSRADGARKYIHWEHAGPATRTAISGLVEDTTYHARVGASNDTGAGDWSEPGSGTTPEARPAGSFAPGRMSPMTTSGSRSTPSP